MKKYLGSKFTLFAAIVVIPLFICLPTAFGILALTSSVEPATVFIAIGGVSCSGLGGVMIVTCSKQFFSRGEFGKDEIRVKTIFSKPTSLPYKNCVSCGIGWYIHGVLNSNLGTKVYFIFFSYNAFNESFRHCINLWKPSTTQIKTQFDPKLYAYLIEVLPKKQREMLVRDYEKYIAKTKK